MLYFSDSKNKGLNMFKIYSTDSVKLFMFYEQQKLKYSRT